MLRQTIKLGPHEVGDGKPVFIIAEIGVNHDGSLGRALDLIRAAKEAGADAVKFQKRNIEAIYTGETLKNIGLKEHGIQYAVDTQKKVELGEEDFGQIIKLCDELGITFFCTPFDEPSVDFLERLSVPFYKIGSPDFTNLFLLEKIAATGKPVIISCGMADLSEVDYVVNWLKDKEVRCVLLHCQSTYPANLDDINLSLIQYYRDRYKILVGYSGHEQSIITTVAAAALGACVIERHLTYDKKADGPDHPASLEAHEFAKMVRQIKTISRAIGAPGKRLIQGEMANRQALGKQLVAAREIPAGQTLSREDLAARVVNDRVLPILYYPEILGLKAEVAIRAGEPIKLRYLHNPNRKKEEAIPKFRSKWGLKVGFENLEFMSGFQPKLVEFHLTAADLKREIRIPKIYDCELYVHVPIYDEHHRIIDLCSSDHQQWRDSIVAVNESINLVRRMAKFFMGVPKVVMHVGGMTLAPAPREDWPKMIERAVESLKLIDTTGIEFLPENLTSLAWHFAGQWYQNVFNKPGEVEWFCEQLGLDMCFDTAHGWLAAGYYGFDFYDFMWDCMPYVSHLHLVDARRPNDEGLQIGTGEIDFGRVLDIVRKSNRRMGISWVPEIWEGHLDEASGFKEALRRLAALKHTFLRVIEK